jgi:hypothetical protein
LSHPPDLFVLGFSNRVLCFCPYWSGPPFSYLCFAPSRDDRYVPPH